MTPGAGHELTNCRQVDVCQLFLIQWTAPWGIARLARLVTDIGARGLSTQTRCIELFEPFGNRLSRRLLLQHDPLDLETTGPPAGVEIAAIAALSKMIGAATQITPICDSSRS